MNLLNKEKLLDYYQNHKGEVIGAGAGLLIALSVLFLGILKILFIFISVFAGYYVGKRIYKDRNYIRNLIDRVLRFFNV